MDMRTRTAQARSFLFVPANRPERFDKAVRSGADAVIIDLEDSVPPSEKAAAREALAGRWEAIASDGLPVLLRINALGGAGHGADLGVIGRLPGLAAVMVPKAESTAALSDLYAQLGIPLLPLVETVAGLEAVKGVAAAQGVVRLVIGQIDFMADAGIDCDETESELLPLRFAVAVATRSANLAPAVDGVTVHTDDEHRLREDTLRSRRFGFSGKLCIHPRQVSVVHAAFAPSADELAWAHRVVDADAAASGAAVQLDGRMVDLPVVLRARRTLASGEPR